MFRSSRGPKIRRAEHAGSWYTGNASELRAEIQQYLDDAATKLPSQVEDGDPSAPVKSARVIIAPHAGYRFSGPTAGVAYHAFDINESIKNVFVIGPSHHVYLDGASVSSCDELATPLGNLKVNKDITNELLSYEGIGTVDKRDEEAEHSLEMHFPFVKYLFERTFSNSSLDEHPTVTPLMVGNTSKATERRLGEILAPYVKDESNAFVISSDFAHWGRRFRYTYYLKKQQADPVHGISLASQSQVDSETAIHESIARVDEICMRAISTGTYDLFQHSLETTHNTVCGRHPIGVMMAALEVLKKQLVIHEDLSKFKFTDYTRSGLVDDLSDSSVSYASAYAKIQGMNLFDFLEQIEDLENEEFLACLTDSDTDDEFDLDSNLCFEQSNDGENSRGHAIFQDSRDAITASEQPEEGKVRLNGRTLQRDED